MGKHFVVPVPGETLHAASLLKGMDRYFGYKRAQMGKARAHAPVLHRLSYNVATAICAIIKQLVKAASYGILSHKYPYRFRREGMLQTIYIGNLIT